eukprot:299654-Rhodomonas_salina.1
MNPFTKLCTLPTERPSNAHVDEPDVRTRAEEHIVVAGKNVHRRWRPRPWRRKGRRRAGMSGSPARQRMWCPQALDEAGRPSQEGGLGTGLH